MSADLHIHIFKGITEDDLAAFFSNTIGSKWFDPTLLRSRSVDTFSIMLKTPSIWIGEVSWLKGMEESDEQDYVPDIVGSISELIGEELPEINDEFIGKVCDLYHTAAAHGFYRTADKETVIEFFEAHKGQRVFTISW